MKILFVEDDEDLNMVGTEQLRHLGHEVISAFSYSDALAQLEVHLDSVSIVIADHRLPDGAGVDLVSHIQRNWPRIRVCVVSAVLLGHETAHLDSLGIPYFRKPLLYSNVIKQLQTARKPSQESIRRSTNSPMPVADALPASTGTAFDHLRKAPADIPAGIPIHSHKRDASEVPPPPPPAPKGTPAALPSTVVRKKGFTNFLFKS